MKSDCVFFAQKYLSTENHNCPIRIQVGVTGQLRITYGSMMDVELTAEQFSELCKFHHDTKDLFTVVVGYRAGQQATK